MNLRLFSICMFGLLVFGTINTSFAESDWKIYKLLTNDGRIFKMPYNIVDAEIRSIELDGDTGTLITKISSNKGGTLEISIPRDLLDAKSSNNDLEIFILEDKHEIKAEEIESTPCFRTFAIKLSNDSKEIEFIGTFMSYNELQKAVKPLHLFPNASYHADADFVISGCTSLSLDESNIRIDVLDPQGQIYKTTNIAPNIDGTFSTSLASDELKTTKGYTITATYANYTAVPEFPIAILILATSVMAIMLFKTSTVKHLS